MLDQLNEIEQNALKALQQIEEEQALEAWRVSYLGRNSPLMRVFDALGGLPKEERPQVGRHANEVKRALEEAYQQKMEALRQAALQRALQSERLDVTLPGRPLVRGRYHPLNQTLRRIFAIFAEMGFQVYRSRDIESDEYNFQLLNFPPHHPAREMQDSFYLDLPHPPDNPILFRTHTSPGQIRAMREFAAQNPADPPPVRIVLPGMCARYEPSPLAT